MDECYIQIAVIGESGTGKSTLINAIRVVNADHESAAKVGPIKTTVEVQKYSHPEHSHLEFCDVSIFSKDNDLENIDIDKYDFFIVTCQSRLKEIDAWLIKKIIDLKKRFYFVRTMVDCSIESDRKSHAETHDPIQVLNQIRGDCIRELKSLGVSDPQVFLVDNYNTDEFDFGKLKDAMLQAAPEIQKEKFTNAQKKMTCPNDEEKHVCDCSIL